MARTVRSGGALRFALLLTLISLLGIPQALLAADGNGLGRALRAQERVGTQVLGRAGVVGTGLGQDAAGRHVVEVYTLDARVRGLPRSAEGVGVRRVVTGLVTARACQDTNDPTERCNRPVPIGVSVGHPSITAGTIGARVRNGAGQVFALSNNHVLANSNSASIGDAALQPGPFDGGTNPADSIGTLHDFQPISFSSNNTMDAAIALSTTGQLGRATLTTGYGTPSSSTTSPSVGLSVKKCGRTTGCTNGSVAAVNVTVDVCYRPQGPFCARGWTARFVNQFSVSPGGFSAGGDSGSLIVTNSGNNPVGLLFAGSSTNTFANPIGPVLTRFGVTIDSGGSTPPTPTPTQAPTPTPTQAPTPTPTQPSAGAPTNLSVTARPQGTVKMDLAWNGGGATVDIQRRNPGSSSFGTIATTSNGGSYRDNLGRNPGSGTYTYRVCNAGTATCSNEAAGVAP